MMNRRSIIHIFLLTVLMLFGTLAGADNRDKNPDGTTSYVVGGEDVLPDELQAVAALVPAGETQYANSFCSGILVDSEWVLTAAHCAIKRTPHSIQVQLGNRHVEPGRGERLSVSAIFVHPDYISDTVPDVALLRLEKASEYAPVPILTEEDAYLAEPGVVATASGWGRIIQERERYATTLQKAELPIVSNTVCGALDGPYPGWITEYEVCAGYDDGSKDTASGDSGGPLMVPDGDGWRTAGLTSWGNGTYYGVYSRVSAAAEWLQQTMDNNSSQE